METPSYLRFNNLKFLGPDDQTYISPCTTILGASFCVENTIWAAAFFWPTCAWSTCYWFCNKRIKCYFHYWVILSQVFKNTKIASIEICLYFFKITHRISFQKIFLLKFYFSLLTNYGPPNPYILYYFFTHF